VSEEGVKEINAMNEQTFQNFKRAGVRMSVRPWSP
jgi:hypothetical protein